MNRPITHKIFASVAVVAGDRVLLVQEAKPDVRGKWNLPGGHVDPGETLRAAAVREVREETGLTVEPEELLVIFTGPTWVRFVFIARAAHEGAYAGDEILDVRAVTVEESRAWPDERLEHVTMLRGILDAVETPRSAADLIVEGVTRIGDEGRA